MCFYDCIKYTCDCWKWGNLRAQCDKEYRIGEACGLKLTNETIYEGKLCRICSKLRKKSQLRDDLINKIGVWKSEGRLEELWSSVQQCRDTIQQINEEIPTLLKISQEVYVRPDKVQEELDMLLLKGMAADLTDIDEFLEKHFSVAEAFSQKCRETQTK
jgi:hypothetical protein